MDPQAERIRKLYELTPEQLHETLLHDLPKEHVVALTEREVRSRYERLSEEELREEGRRVWDAFERVRSTMPDIRRTAERLGDAGAQTLRDAEYNWTRYETTVNVIADIQRTRDRKRFGLDTGKTTET